MRIPCYLDIFISTKNKFYLKSQSLKSFLSSLNIADFQNLPITLRSIYYYKRGDKSISLSNLSKLNMKKSLLQKIYLDFDYIYSYGHTGLNLPHQYSKELAYFLGVLNGDGHLSKRGLTIYSADESYLEFIVKPIVKTLFNYSPNISFERCFKLHIYSLPLYYFLTKVIGVVSGKKKSKLRVPNFVYKKNSFMRFYLRGLFDTDGGVSLSKGRLNIHFTSATKSYLLEIQRLLLNFGLDIKGPYLCGNKRGWELRSFKRSEIMNFYKRIGTFYSRKQTRLSAYVA